MADHGTRAFGLVIIFIVCMLTYPSMAERIDDNAGNATLTNDVWVLLDEIFGLFWTMLSVLFLGMAIYEALQATNIL
ncbi:MAG: hypothetical protein ACYS76_04570 [Planctomycetota bacterium]|jgi:hypothetical protein